MKEFWHMIAHWIHWNEGKIISEWGDDGYLWMGFRCSGCGCVTNSFKTETHKTDACEI